MWASERAESMRNTTRFGFFGFVASMCFFCLSTVTGSPHDSKPTDPLNPAAREDPLLLLTNAPFLHQLQEQNLAVLKALEQLREERDGALDRYNQTITSQLNILKDAFLFQREQELDAARNSNRFILTVAVSRKLSCSARTTIRKATLAGRKNDNASCESKSGTRPFWQAVDRRL